jgi:tRNA/rRNA methyltransferase
VRTEVAANVGATARVMRNFGLRDLVLVAPVADPLAEEARRLSTHGESILHTARRVADLGEAVADCVLVAATSARIEGVMRPTSMGLPDEILPRLVEALPAGPVALVFGPEPSGLTNAEVSRCHYLIHIPSDETYPALNLAQAVGICLYALRRCWLRAAGAMPGAAKGPASFAEQERMFSHQQNALEEIHYLWGAKAESLMHAVRHLISRAGPTPTEVRLLHGLARQILWYTRHHPPPEAQDGI